jgi:spore germination protein YaaH
MTQLIAEAKTEGFTGWNFDIEAVTGKDTNTVTDFYREAAQRLHGENLTLSIVVYGKTDNETYDPATAFDLKQLGVLVDQVQIMAYNYHNEFTRPGGQTPRDWYERVIEHALKNLPREKIAIGLSTHGYFWDGDEVVGLTYTQAQKVIGERDMEVVYSESEMAQKAMNADESEIMYFEDAYSIVQKVMLARSYGLNIFALWRIGAEDPQVWEMLRNF